MSEPELHDLGNTPSDERIAQYKSFAGITTSAVRYSTEEEVRLGISLASKMFKHFLENDPDHKQHWVLTASNIIEDRLRSHFESYDDGVKGARPIPEVQELAMQMRGCYMDANDEFASDTPAWQVPLLIAALNDCDWIWLSRGILAEAKDRLHERHLIETQNAEPR